VILKTHVKSPGKWRPVAEVAEENKIYPTQNLWINIKKGNVNPAIIPGQKPPFLRDLLLPRIKKLENKSALKKAYILLESAIL
jgi:hypothetical protein